MYGELRGSIDCEKEIQNQTNAKRKFSNMSTLDRDSQESNERNHLDKDNITFKKIKKD